MRGITPSLNCARIQILIANFLFLLLLYGYPLFSEIAIIADLHGLRTKVHVWPIKPSGSETLN